MSIGETVAALESIKQQELKEATRIARVGFVYAGEVEGLLNDFESTLDGLPFTQIEGKLHDTAETAKAEQAQFYQIGGKLTAIVGDTENQHAQTAVQVSYETGTAMAQSYLGTGEHGAQLALQLIQHDLNTLRDMVVALKEKLGQSKELAREVEGNFKVICGSTGSERLVKHLAGSEVLGKDDNVAAFIAQNITAYQQHLKS